jgi:membrane-associated protease RseP (regulator of RpoE activity)
MNFYLYDITFCLLFIIFVSTFLYKKRKNITVEKPLILYRTKFGIKLINKIAKKKKLLGFLEKVVIFFGYVLMFVGLFMVYLIVKIIVFTPEKYFGIINAPPIFPLIPYFTNIFDVKILPPFYFTYWIIIIAVATISHEFFHGIFFKKEGVKIKSTGFAFLGPFLAAFVDPEEKDIKKVKNHKQLAAISAGTFANLLVAILFSLISLLFISFAFVPAGATFSVYTFSQINVSSIEGITNNTLLIDGINFTGIKSNNKTYFLDEDTLEEVNNGNHSVIYAFDDTPAIRNKLRGAIIGFEDIEIKNNEHLSKVISLYSPGDNVTIKTLFNNSVEEYNITLIARQDDKTKPYIGIASYQMNFLGKILSKILLLGDYKPRFANDLIIFIRDLLYWLILINLGMAFFNMVPSSVLDGGRFFYITMLSITKSEKFAGYSYKIVSSLILAILLFITIIWGFHFFS